MIPILRWPLILCSWWQHWKDREWPEGIECWRRRCRRHLPRQRQDITWWRHLRFLRLLPVRQTSQVPDLAADERPARQPGVQTDQRVSSRTVAYYEQRRREYLIKLRGRFWTEKWINFSTKNGSLGRAAIVHIFTKFKSNSKLSKLAFEAEIFAV